MDDFGELVGSPWAAAELTQDVPGLEPERSRARQVHGIGRGRLASFWDAGLFRPRYGILRGSPQCVDTLREAVTGTALAAGPRQAGVEGAGDQECRGR